MGIVGKVAGKVLEKTPPCCAVIAAGGTSRRMGGTDKLFAPLGGKPVLLHTLMAFERTSCIQEIIVVTRAESLARVSGLAAEHGLTKLRQVVPGGEDRLRSVLAGLLAVSRKMKLVAVHDGARPLVSGALIEAAVQCAAKYQAAVPLVQALETVKTVKDGRIDATLDRKNIYLAQTPQVFQTDLLKAALQNAVDRGISVTDDAQAAELIGLKAAFVKGERRNIKITGPEDLWIAEALLGGTEDADRAGL